MAEAFQRSEWAQAERTIAGLLGNVSALTLRSRTIPLSYNVNLVVYRGLVAKAVVASALERVESIPALACYVSVLNSKIPAVGRLVINRCIHEYKRWRTKGGQNDNRKRSLGLIAHLCNQGVCGELLPLEILLDLLLGDKQPVECFAAASDLIRQAGAHLSSRPALKAALDSVFDRFREVVHERKDIPQSLVQQLEDLQKLRQRKFRTYPAIDIDLDLLVESARITHEISLEDEIDTSSWVDTFQVIDRLEEFDAIWQEIRNDHLNGVFLITDSDNDHDEQQDAVSDEPAQVSDATIAAHGGAQPVASTAGKVIPAQRGVDPFVDQTNQDIVAVRRRIYLIFNHGLSFEQAAHEILSQRQRELRGSDKEIVAMIVEASAQAKAYTDFYGHLGARLCRAVPEIAMLFEAEFVRQYEGLHRLETNKIRNIAMLYAHLLYRECISWERVFQNVELGETTTTSATRIFLMNLFQRLAHLLGHDHLKQRLAPASSFSGIFPKKPRKRLAFAINFLTTIGLGGLTEEMRNWFANGVPDETSSAASSSSFSSSSSESDSESDRRKRKRHRRSSISSSSDSGSESRDEKRSRRRRSASSDSESDRKRSKRRKHSSKSSKKKKRRSEDRKEKKSKRSSSRKSDSPEDISKKKSRSQRLDSADSDSHSDRASSKERRSKRTKELLNANPTDEKERPRESATS